MRKIISGTIKLVLGVFFILILIFYMFINLFTYSPYYAKQINKEDEHREVMFLMRNLFYMNKPKEKEYSYDYDGQNTLMTDTYRFTTSFEYEQTCLVYQNYKLNENYIFLFDKNLNLIEIIDYENNHKSVPVTEGNAEKIKNQLLEDVQPFLDLQKKPIINLQWIFNYLYGDNIYWRFSDMN